MRLRDDRVARDVLRIVLATAAPMAIQGTGARCSIYGGLTLRRYADETLRMRTFGLMNEDGLLDVFFGACGSPGLWCLRSERVIGTTERGHWHRFRRHRALRDALAALLKPFEGERTEVEIYDLPSLAEATGVSEDALRSWATTDSCAHTFRFQGSHGVEFVVEVRR